MCINGVEMNSKIPEGWRECKLGKAPFEIIDGDRGTNYPKQNEFENNGYCLFLNAKNVTSKGFIFDECCFITKEKDQILRKGKLQRNDIVLTTRGTVGNIGFFDNSVPFDHIRINSGMVIIRPNPNEIFAEYAYQLFKNLKSEFGAFVTGSAQPQIPIRDIKDISIILPPLPEQRAIASVLSSLDDKIDLLHRENKTLEKMAEAIFRQWFIEEADDSWETGTLGDFVNITYGKNLPIKNLQNNGYPVFGGNGQIGFFDKYIYEKPQVLVSCRGEASGTVNISLPKSFITNNSLILEINKRREITFEYLKYYALNTDFKMYVSGSAQPQITIADLYAADFTLPDKKTIDCFSDIVRTWELKITNNQRQIRTLEKLRDTLLPKLMSGEVRVKL